MHYCIQGLHLDSKSHVILGQPKTLAKAENLAKLEEAVSLSTPKARHTQSDVSRLILMVHIPM